MVDLIKLMLDPNPDSRCSIQKIITILDVIESEKENLAHGVHIRQPNFC